MRKIFILPAILVFIFSCTETKQAKNEYPISPVPFTKFKVNDNFWAKRIKTKHDVTIPIAIQKSEETGRVDNFAIAGGLKEGVFCLPFPFDDSDIYKII